MEKLRYSIDNTKYKGKGKQRVLITNMSSATDCIGKKLGTCQLPKNVKCYAVRDEIQYPAVLPHRRRQARQWKAHNAYWFNAQIAQIQKRARVKITHHRLNESGEIETAMDFIKAAEISAGNVMIGIKTFTYTSRKDLFKTMKKMLSFYPLVVNGSGFMADNEYRVVNEGYKAKKGEYWCPDKCDNCRLCKEKLGVVILSKARHTKKED